jgi:hypothetical protein
VKPKFLERIEAKLELLQHVQGKYGLHKELVGAAKSELGAELARGLSGELGAELLKGLQADIARLERGELQPGDLVNWQFGNERRTDTVVTVTASSVAVKFSGGRMKDEYSMNRPEAKPADLEELRKLLTACLTAGVK